MAMCLRTSLRFYSKTFASSFNSDIVSLFSSLFKRILVPSTA